MKKKLLMALLVGVLAVPSSVSCFAAESTDAAAADSDGRRNRGNGSRR